MIKGKFEGSGKHFLTFFFWLQLFAVLNLVLAPAIFVYRVAVFFFHNSGTVKCDTRKRNPVVSFSLAVSFNFLQNQMK